MTFVFPNGIQIALQYLNFTVPALGQSLFASYIDCALLYNTLWESNYFLVGVIVF